VGVTPHVELRCNTQKARSPASWPDASRQSPDAFRTLLIGPCQAEKLHRETLKALQVPKVQEKLAALGMDPMIMTPSEFDLHVQKEIAANAALVKAAGIKTN
jgi:Tripartite tricarboxylate transporter family receptor